MEVIRNQEYLLLPSHEVGRLLSSDDINVPNEETIFNSLMIWARHDTERASSLSTLLVHVKLPLLPPQVSKIITHLLLPASVFNEGELWFTRVYSIRFN